MRTTVTDRRAGREILADRGVTLADHAVERRGQARVAHAPVRPAPARCGAAAAPPDGCSPLPARPDTGSPPPSAPRTRDPGPPCVPMPSLTKVCARSFVSFASSSTARASRTIAVFSGVDRVVVAVRRQAQARPRLLQRGAGLIHAQVEVGRHQPGERLTLGDAAAEVDEQLVQPAGHFHAEGDLLFGGQRARHRDGADERFLGGRDDPHLTRRSPGRRGRLSAAEPAHRRAESRARTAARSRGTSPRP